MTSIHELKILIKEISSEFKIFLQIVLNNHKIELPYNMKKILNN